MFFRLLKLEWKSFFRSANLGRGLGVKIFLGFLAVYFLVSFLGLGIALYPIMEEVYPGEQPIKMVNGFLLLWFVGEFVMRFLLQNLPVMDIKPLLTKRITRKNILHFLLAKTSYSFYNFLTLVTAVPFAIYSYHMQSISLLQMLAWLIAVAGIVYSSNFFIFWVQKRFSNNLKALIPFIVICLGLYAIEYFGVYSISNLFGSFFDAVLQYPILCLVPVLLAVISYWVTYKDLKENLYLDAYMEEKQGFSGAADLSWTSRFGALAPFLQLDLKLIWRNKRTKSALWLSLAFLAYGLFFYTNPKFDGGNMMVFVGVMITGIFIINFGQYIPAWDSSYFPLLRTRPITMEKYLEAKAVLMYGSALILMVLSTPYLYFGWDKVYTNFACAIYNVGINVPVILFFGAYNKKRIDLSAGSAFNYQGIGAAQWLVGIPLLLAPTLIWFGVSFLKDQNTANLVLIALGLIGLLLRKVIIKGIAEMYVEKRYVMLEGFKQKD